MSTTLPILVTLGRAGLVINPVEELYVTWYILPVLSNFAAKA